MLSAVLTVYFAYPILSHHTAILSNALKLSSKTDTNNVFPQFIFTFIRRCFRRLVSHTYVALRSEQLIRQGSLFLSHYK